MFEDSVYVLTPQGRVIVLPLGSTPVDFAYHVHSELGHRCRGARVDGEMVSLNYALKNGQTVEIVAAKTGGPSRDWLNPELGFIHSQRARAKVRQWFNSQNLQDVYTTRLWLGIAVFFVATIVAIVFCAINWMFAWRWTSYVRPKNR